MEEQCPAAECRWSELHCSASEAATVRTQRYNNTGDERLAPTPQCEGSSNVCVDVAMQLCDVVLWCCCDVVKL